MENVGLIGYPFFDIKVLRIVNHLEQVLKISSFDSYDTFVSVVYSYMTK